MGSPYTSTSVSGYNSNPPSDDGSSTEANRGKWSTIKTKLTDPLNTFASALNTALSTAFGKVVGGAGITSVAANYTVAATDQGKLVKATASAITITTPDATDVGSPFVFRILNNSSGDITLDGSGSQTVDGAANATIAAGAGVTVSTDGTNWFTDGQNFTRTQVIPQGYLTATSATPQILTDVAAGTAVYYALDKGVLVPVPNGTTFTVKEFSELTLSLHANHLASTIYDVFLFDDSGTIRIGTGPAWSNSGAGAGARGTGAGTTELVRLKGLWTNKVSMTARNGASTYTVAASCGLYLGSIYMDGTNGQLSCLMNYGTSRKWGIWNAYNRKRILLRVGDSTASWAYGTATIRASNNSSANSGTVFAGLAEEQFDIDFRQNVDSTSNVADGKIGIGWNSTTAFSGFAGAVEVPVAAGGTGSTSRYTAAPALGINTVTALEQGGSNSATFKGGHDDMLLTVDYWG